MTLAQAKKTLREAEKLAALGQKGMALEIVNRVYEFASNMIAPGAHHDAHMRAWLDIYCDVKFFMGFCK